MRVLDRCASRRFDSETLRRLQVDVGSGLAAGDLFRRDGHREEPGQSGELENQVDDRTVRRRCDRQRPAAGQALDRFGGAVDQRQVLTVDPLEAADDLGRDLLRRVRHADHLVHVAGPLGRAHAHHVPLGAFVPSPAALPRKLLAGRVPDVLGVDENAVQVEDHRLDHGKTR